ncbi:MAG: ABC1 kinase family protein [Phycisphaerae bacterium]
MSRFNFTRNLHSLNRLRQIAITLTQHGFGHVVTQMDLSRFVPLWISRKEPNAQLDTSHEAIGKRIAAVCAELGPTFIKLAQLLASRPDVAPPDVIRELKKLQDKVPPFDSDTSMQIISEALGRPAEDAFAEIDSSPIASGSIGQVHQATTRDGRRVVVKVRRPGIENTIIGDMQILKWLASNIESLVPELGVFQPMEVVDELEDLLRHELDFINEAASTQRFHEAFADDPVIQVPEVIWELTGERVLTLERLSGKRFDEMMATASPDGFSTKPMAAILANAYLKQIFELGHYHADPHPGNMLFNPPDRIGLIDFGQIGIVSDQFIGELIMLIYACVNRDMPLAVDTLIDMGVVGTGANHRRVERALQGLVDKYHGLPVRRMDAAQLLHEFADAMRGEKVTIPRELSRLIKAIGMVSTTISRLDPELNLIELLRPHIQVSLRKRFSASVLTNSGKRMGWNLMNVIGKLPRRLRTVLRQFETGNWELHVRHENIDKLIKELDRASNRLAFSIVIAAIIVGSSVVVSAETQLTVFGLKFQHFGIVGYSLAGILGLGLAWAIFRSGRLH